MSQQEKFRQRFETYYPMLCRVALGYLSDRQECEDIVQECFIAVWHNGRHELEEREFLSYMTRAVKNNCISNLRKQPHQTVSLDEDATLSNYAQTLAEEEAPEVTYDEKLKEVLDVLPPKCKEIFLLSKLHGMKYQDIATELDISVKTIENQMGKALKLIREQLKSSRFIIIFVLMSLIFHKL